MPEEVVFTRDANGHVRVYAENGTVTEFDLPRGTPALEFLGRMAEARNVKVARKEVRDATSDR